MSTAVRLLTTEQLLALGSEGGAARATIQSASGRQLLVVQAGEHGFFALDALCHHLGASLAHGELVDIEDEGVHLVCPAHGRHICLRTGELVDDALDEATGRCRMVRRGVKQRMHSCEIRPDGLWARVSNPTDDGGPVESDKYNLPAPACMLTGRIGFHARKQRATTAVAAKLGLPPRAPLERAAQAAHAALVEAAPTWPEEEEIELTPPQAQPQLPTLPAKLQPAKRTIEDYFSRVRTAQQQQRQPSVPGVSADDPMDVG